MKKITKIIVFFLIVLILSVSTSFAYFSAVITGSETNATITTSGGIMNIAYNGGSNISISNIYPKAEEWSNKTFTVTGSNNTSISMGYKLNLVIDKNTFTTGAIKYSLNSINNEANGQTLPSIIELNSIETGSSNINLGEGYFNGPTNGNKIHTYNLKLYFPETNTNQNNDKGKEIKAHIEINSIPSFTELVLSGENLVFHNTNESKMIIEIDGKTVQNKTPEPTSISTLNSLQEFDIISSIGKENLIYNGEVPFGDGWVNPRSILGSDAFGEYIEATSYIDTFFRGENQNRLYPIKGLTNYIISSEIWSNAAIEIHPTVPLHYHTMKKDAGNHDGRSSSTLLSNNEILTPNKWDTIVARFKTINEEVFFTPFGYNDITLPSTTIVRMKKLKLEEGYEWSTPWTPSLAEVSYDTFTKGVYKTKIELSEPLRSAGGVKDEIFKDTDGLWKVRRILAEEIFSSAQSDKWSRSAYYNSPDGKFIVFRYQNENVEQLKNTPNIVCTHAPFVASAWDYSSYGAAISSYGNYLNFWIKVPSTTATDLNSFNTWLANTGPLKIIYEMSAPVIEVLPNNIQTKLNNIPSYNEETYIYTKGNINPFLKGRAKVN